MAFVRNSFREPQKINISLPHSATSEQLQKCEEEIKNLKQRILDLESRLPIIFKGNKKEMFDNINVDKIKLNELIRLIQHYNIISEQWFIPGKGYEDRRYIRDVKNQLSSGAVPKSVGHEKDFIIVFIKG